MKSRQNRKMKRPFTHDDDEQKMKRLIQIFILAIVFFFLFNFLFGDFVLTDDGRRCVYGSERSVDGSVSYRTVG